MATRFQIPLPGMFLPNISLRNPHDPRAEDESNFAFALRQALRPVVPPDMQTIQQAWQWPGQQVLNGLNAAGQFAAWAPRTAEDQRRAEIRARPGTTVQLDLNAKPETPRASPAGAFQFVPVPGDKETSGYRDPKRNAEVGGVANSFHTRRDASGNAMATDRVPPKGMSMADYAAQLSQLNPHLQVINEGDHVHMEPKTGGASPAGAFGLPSAPGFEAYGGFLNSALGQLDQAQAAQMTPWGTTVEQSPLPTLPEAPQFAAPDFTAGNEAFAAAKPKNPFEEEGSEERIKRNGFFQGMAQALLTLQPGQPVGWGEMLLKAGMGALSGRMAGAEKVEKQQREYEKDMQAYNLALSQRNDQQAAQLAETANKNLAAVYQNNILDFQTKLSERNRLTNSSIQGGQLVVSRQDAEGNQRLEVLPIEPIVQAEFATRRASLLAGAAGPAQSHAQWSHQQNINQMLATATMGLGNSDPAVAGQAALTGIVSTLGPLVESGAIRSILDPQQIAALEQEGLRIAMERTGMTPEQMETARMGAAMGGKDPLGEFRDGINQYVTQQLTSMIYSNPALLQELSTHPLVGGQALLTRSQNTRTTERVDSRGRRSVSTTIDN